MDEAILRSFYWQLVDINRETFEGKEFDIAYHALSRRLRCRRFERSAMPGANPKNCRSRPGLH